MSVYVAFTAGGGAPRHTAHGACLSEARRKKARPVCMVFVDRLDPPRGGRSFGPRLHADLPCIYCGRPLGEEVRGHETRG